jgi:membrane protein DedA with SNARE-associated domain
MVDAERASHPVRAPAPPRSRGRLALYLVPIVASIVVAQVARAIWPSLLEHAPAVLLVATSAISRLLLVQPLVPPLAFFAIALARLLVIATLYYAFGREYGDAALRWGEERLGGPSSLLARVERGFRKAGRPLVACWWSPFIALMAGATGMRARVFFPLLALGAVGRVSAIYFVGDWLREPLTAVSDFIGRYAIYLTPITIGLTVLQIWYGRRHGRGLPIGTLDHLEEDFEAVEVEVAGEATYTSAPEPD